ncbi:MAG: ABC transporter ATP-binding protein [Mycoplasmataceae bacterium]|nr:ABC transporter ATP-binding protein [Mycoplasmataceae bacterium]
MKNQNMNNIWNQINSISSNGGNINSYENLKTIINDSDESKELIIEVKNLKHEFKTIKKTKHIYDNINFNIYKGEKVAFLGPNGAGKTLMVETICGTRKQTSGEIIYHFDHKKSNPYEHLGVQFQDFEFPTGLTVKDMIDFIIKLNNITNIVPEEFNYMLETFQLKQILNSRVSKLSGGQKQRLNVTLSLLNKPKVVFLDEFTTGLDIAIKNSITNFIIEYCKKNNTSLVLISHDIDSIEQIVDRIIILADKTIKIDLSIKQVEKDFGSVSKLLKKYITY